MREKGGAVLIQEGKQSLALLEDEGAGHGRQCRRHAAQYHVVLQRSAEQNALRVCQRIRTPSVGEGLRCLNTLNCLAPERTGKTASRETEQNVHAAVLWSSCQRGLPEQVCLEERQVTRSRRHCAVRVPEMRRSRGAVVIARGQTDPCLFSRC